MLLDYIIGDFIHTGEKCDVKYLLKLLSFASICTLRYSSFFPSFLVFFFITNDIILFFQTNTLLMDKAIDYHCYACLILHFPTWKPVSHSTVSVCVVPLCVYTCLSMPPVLQSEQLAGTTPTVTQSWQTWVGQEQPAAAAAAAVVLPDQDNS